MLRRRLLGMALGAALLVSVPALAQDATPTTGGDAGAGAAAAAIEVSEQLVLNGIFTANRVVIPANGWLVVNAVVDGQLGPTVGIAPVNAGESTGVMVFIDTLGATPQVVASLHEDTGNIGQYEYDMNPSVDVPIAVEGAATMATARVTALTVWDQQAVNDTVIIGSVITDTPLFVSIRGGAEGQTPAVLGSASVGAGTTIGLPVSIQGGTGATTLTATLHSDQGTVGTFEFDGQTGADVPVAVNNQNAEIPFVLSDEPVILTAAGIPIPAASTPALGVNSQDVGGDGVTGTLVADSVSAPVNGWVEVHADSAGQPGKPLGMVNVPQGDNSGVSVPLNAAMVPAAPPQTLPPAVWAMLHIDDSAPGVYEYLIVPGADAPIVLNGAVVTIPVQITNPAAAPAGTPTVGALPLGTPTAGNGSGSAGGAAPAAGTATVDPAAQATPGGTPAG